jgi:hypothetical protein
MIALSLFDFLFINLQNKEDNKMNWLNYVETSAIVITLIIIIKYTYETNRLAKAAWLSVKLQEQEIGLRKRPIVTILCGNEAKFEFLTLFNNFSNVHAKALIKAIIKINGKTMQLPPGYHYNGERIWHIQAVGPSGPKFKGHLNFPVVFDYNNIQNIDHENLEASVTIESWIVNLYDDDSELYDESNRNPTRHWDWNSKAKRWVPEIAPLDLA